MKENVDITFVVPAFKPKMKEESIGTLILAKKLLLNRYEISIARYWDVEPSPYEDYDSFRNAFVAHISRIQQASAKLRNVFVKALLWC